MSFSNTRFIGYAILAAALYALSAPFSKLLLDGVAPMMLAALLYLGAGAGMLAMTLVRRLTGPNRESRLTRRELPYAVGMILLDAAAPILLMLGLTSTTPANASLLNNFEIVATSLIALLLFKEAIGRKLWLAIGLITLSSMILSFTDRECLRLSPGSLLVLLACVCWGFENNLTRMMSQRDPMEIVVVKGFGSGLIALFLALFAGERLPAAASLAPTLILGFVAYGLSIFFYVHAQRGLGAARTSAYYALSPFIGAGLSLIMFRQAPGVCFLIALALMIPGAFLAAAAE